MESEQIKLNKNESQENKHKKMIKCHVCGEVHDESITHGIKIKGAKKYICQECADTIHGLV